LGEGELMAGVPFSLLGISSFGFLSADDFERACFDTRASLLLLCLLACLCFALSAWPFRFRFDL
jgi:hypothetical protein